MNLNNSTDEEIEDCTALLAFSKDFKHVVSSNSTQRPLAAMLNFDDDARVKIPKSGRRTSFTTQNTSLSMKEVLEKENEDRLIRIQLEKAEKNFAAQKKQTDSLESELRSLGIRYDKDICEYQRREQMTLSTLKELKKSTDTFTPSPPTATIPSSVDSAVSGIKENLGQIQEHITKNTALLKVTQRKLSLITKERDALQSVITDFVRELDKDIEGFTCETADHTRCQALLTKVQGELDETKKILQETLVSRKAEESVLNRKVSFSQENNELKVQIDELKKELEEKSDELKLHEERRHLQGYFDPCTTKIVHFCKNPADIARRKNASLAQDLRAENVRLLERLRIVESEGAVQDLTIRVDEKLAGGVSSQEVEALKEQLVKAELKNQRLGEAFKSTSQEFRSIVYQLLGYRVNLTGNHQYQLMSMYAETPKDVLCFKTVNGEIQILANNYSLSFEENCEHYLQTGNSIPAFLSSITLDLFSRQTFLSQ